jgi:sugar lactone lactonase YvrE
MDAEMAQFELVWPLAAELGEGPVWLESEQALWFTDIKGRHLHRFIPGTGEHQSYSMPGQPSFIVPANDGSMVIGMGLGLYRTHNGKLGDQIAVIEGEALDRTNDATVDSKGRIWFGTMDSAEISPTGAVHVYDGRTLHTVGGNCTITNGPALSPDGRTLYHVDTMAGLIWRFDISMHDELTDGRIFASIDPKHGHPDGVTVDSEGCLWVALWGGWSVRRYAPDGRLLASIRLPCSNVTKIAFGGGDLRTAYVTSARVGLSAEQLAQQPLAGALFAFEAPAAGLPCHAAVLTHD